jgi:hypothetical protein
MWSARDIDELVVHFTFSTLIHTLLWR